MQKLPHSAIRTRVKIEIDSSFCFFVVSPSGKKVAAFGGRQILIVDLHKNKTLANIPIQYKVGAFDFNESESLFFVEERIGKFYDVFSAEKEFGFVRRELAEDFTSSIFFSPKFNLLGVKNTNKKIFELLSIYPKKSLNFSIDFDSHRHMIDEVSESLIFRHPNKKGIEFVDLKNLTSHILVDSIDARFFVLASDKKTLFVNNYQRIQLIDYQKNLILRDFHLDKEALYFYLFVVRPKCLIIFNFENNNLNQFYQYNQKNNQKMSLFQIPSCSTLMTNSYKRIERKGFYMEKDEKENLLLQEIEFGNICELMSTEQKNRRLIKLHMSLERRGLEIKQWKPKRYVQSQPFS